MDKLFFFTFLGLLIVVYGIVDNHVLGDTATFEELENLDLGELDEPDLSDTSTWTSDLGCKLILSVDAFGAVGDGVTDDTQAFRTAWDKACSSQNAVFMVPADRKYLVSTTRFKGPCADNLVIQIDGTIAAPSDPKKWDMKELRTWLSFSNLKNVEFLGTGELYGNGQAWWETSCKTNKSLPCKGAPTALTIALSSGVKVKGITIRDSQQMHFIINQCDAVRVYGVQIYAPESSPNTDGIHITGSTNVVVQDSIIRTGDDCISIVNASSVIKMKHIVCGPGHGISIGSLGKDNSTGIVTKVVLETAVLNGTTNGLRIKTWQGGNGCVEGVRFSNVKMMNVKNPILIDQNYCDSPNPCRKLDSAVQIRKIMYKNISGTTVSKDAIKFDCSDSNPCTEIVLSNVQLESNVETLKALCSNASGRNVGVVKPSADCLEQKKQHAECSSEEETPVHTEL